MKHKAMRTALILTAAACCGAVLLLRCKEPEAKQTLLADESARTAWLELRGWHVAKPEVSQMLVPSAWQTVPGQSWLRLQAAQGLHPEDYAGRSAARYLYPVTNTDSKNMYAELLLCGDVLIGAQVYDASTQLMQSVL